MYPIILASHSLFRYVVLALILITAIKALIGWLGNKSYEGLDNKLSLFTLIATHIQLVLGLVLYFVSDIVATGLADMGAAMKNPALRYWVVEHASIMVVAVVLVTLARSLSKRATQDKSKHMRTAIFLILGLVLILSRIPASSWF